MARSAGIRREEAGKDSMWDENNYDDIIHLPHHVSKTRPQMPRRDRAAQFSPFAALTGYDATIREAGRLTDERIELTESSRELLDGQIRAVAERIAEQPEIAVTYFKPDQRKTGGAYIRVTGRAKKIDRLHQAIVLADGREIPFCEILKLEDGREPSQ